MKSFVVLALLAFAVCSDAINQKFVNELKQIAPYDVYEPEENPFRDWTDEEIDNMLGTKILNIEPKHKKVNIEINDGFDFRKAHPECVSRIRDQARCGSCWAFGGTMALQQRFCQKGEKIELAPQDPVSCDTGNMACNGGWLIVLWSYLSTKGCVKESCFPYSAGNGRVERCISECKNGEPWKKYFTDGYDNYHNAEDIKRDLVNGPLETQFTVYSDFMNYRGGIYVHRSGYRRGGHAVTILGYGTENGVNYWICQNSWNANWGEQGYFRIKMGEVGIDSNAFGGHPIL